MPCHADNAVQRKRHFMESVFAVVAHKQRFLTMPMSKQIRQPTTGDSNKNKSK
jgi:hypothetical protein